MLKSIIRKATAAFIAAIMLSISVTALAAGTVAVKSNQTIYLDGWSVKMTAYSIRDNNYVRLRDIGQAVDFDVTFDSADGTIRIFTQKPYSGELSAMGQTPDRSDVAEATLTVYVDGRAVTMTAYNISGNNYVKLREVGAAVNFSVDWDASRNRVLIDTSKPYTPDTPDTQTQDTPAQTSDIPGGTAVDYSLEANPAIFDVYYTREKYNTDRQRVLDTGEIATGWGSFEPTSEAAINAANAFVDSLSGLTELEKVNRINELLCANMTYKDGATFSGDDFWMGIAYGVCEEYAQMFRYMCYRAAIPCVFVRGGRLPASPTGRHAWNEVYVDGKWQFYDGTLSDSRKAIIMSDTVSSANTGYTYADDNSESTMYRMELFVPGSTK